MVSLLAESYNPHVRYGAAMALGIACAGTGLKEAIALLDPMTNDSVNFVRQGALIASAMILIQQTEATCPRVKDFRALYAKVVVDKHEDVMAKFGAILAQGIIDAGEYSTILGTLNLVLFDALSDKTLSWKYDTDRRSKNFLFRGSCRQKIAKSKILR